MSEDRSLGILLWMAFAFSVCFTIAEYPLIFEEPRRAIIALEMFLSGDYLQPTINGEHYYRKPPLYNALVAGFFKILNNQNEWVVRLVTTISFLIWPFLLFFSTRKELGFKTALFASVLLGISFDTYFTFSRLAEIDIFYSVASLPIFLWSWKWARNSSRWKFFTIIPFYGGLTFFIKGAPALPFTAISMLSMALFFWGKKSISWKWILSFILFISVPLSYFLFLHAYSDSNIESYINTLFFESAGRAEVSSIFSFLLHLVKFPLEILLVLLPGAFILLGLAKYPLSKNQDFKALGILFIANCALYVFIEGAKVRYIYPLIPIAFLFISILFFEWNWNSWLKRILKPYFIFLIFLFATGIFGYMYFTNFRLSLVLLWLTVGVMLMLFWIGIIKKEAAFVGLAVIISAKITFSFIVANEQKGNDFFAQHEKELAENFYKRSFFYPKVYYNSGFERHFNFLYTLSKHRQQILERDLNYSNLEAIYIINKYQRYKAPKNQLLETLSFKNEEYYCIKLR